MSPISTGNLMSLGLLKVAERAQRDPEGRLRSLAPHLEEPALERAYRRVRQRAAVGVDGVTKEAYGERLQENLRDLHQRLKQQRYRHQPLRRVHLPKGDALTRERPGPRWPVLRCRPRHGESALHEIGLITLGAKRAGECSAGNPHAAFDEAGAGNGVTVGPTRARMGKPGRQTRPQPHGPPRQLSTLPGKGPGWVTAPGYSTPGGTDRRRRSAGGLLPCRRLGNLCTSPPNAVHSLGGGEG